MRRGERRRTSARSRLGSTAASGSTSTASSTGAVVWFVCTTVDTDLLGTVLTAFGRAVGAGKDKLVVLVLDRDYISRRTSTWSIPARATRADPWPRRTMRVRPSASRRSASAATKVSASACGRPPSSSFQYSPLSSPLTIDNKIISPIFC